MERRDIGQEILDGILEIKRYMACEIELRTHEVQQPATVKKVPTNPPVIPPSPTTSSPDPVDCC